MPNTRSGSHISLRGSTYYYRRMVPQKLRKAFGQTVVAFSLHTTSRIEAERLAKEDDVEFERRLSQAREAFDPALRRARIAQDIISKTRSHSMAQWGIAYLPAE